MATNGGARYCGICGHQFADTDRACPACNTVGGRSNVDPRANAVAGMPVVAPTPPGRAIRIADLHERVRRTLPEVSTTLAESMTRLAARRQASPPSVQRVRLRSAIVASRLRRAQWRRSHSLFVPPTVEAPVALRAVWFLVAGIPLTLLWILATWVAVCSVVGMPLAARMLELVPSVLTLRTYRAPVARREAWLPSLFGIASPAPAQIGWGSRAVYFVCIGWWLSLVWLLLGYTLSLTVIGMPLAYGMLRRTPAVANLERQ